MAPNVSANNAALTRYFANDLFFFSPRGSVERQQYSIY
jgi:hypothetical protein